MKTLLLLLSLLVATTAEASILPIDLIVQADPTSHTLILRSTAEVPRTTTVKIVDSRELELYTAHLDAGDYLSARLRLAALSPGTYAVVISDLRGKTVQPLVTHHRGVTADTDLAVRSVYPRVDLDDRLLTVNYRLAKTEAISISLADDSGTEVLFDELPATAAVQRAYNLKNLPSGNYHVTVATDEGPAYTSSLRLD